MGISYGGSMTVVGGFNSSTPAAAAAPANFDSMVTCQLHLEGDLTSEGSVTNPATMLGTNSQPFITTKKKFGTYSATSYGDSYISIINGNSGGGSYGGDYTVEFWVYSDYLDTQVREIARNTSGQTVEWRFTQGTSSNMATFYVTFSNQSHNIFNFTTGAWHYVVIEKYNNDGYFYFDGEQVWTTNMINSPLQDKIFLGGSGTVNGSGELSNGYFDDVRITKAARYQGAATIPVPTEAFPALVL